MTDEDVADFLGASLYTFFEGRSEERRRVLLLAAARFGLEDTDVAAQLLVSACKGLLGQPLSEGLSLLSRTQQYAFLIWLSDLVFQANPLAQAEILHALGMHYMTGGEQPEFARYALRRALRLRLGADENWTQSIDTLTQLGVAFDVIGRPGRALRLLELACSLSNVHAIEPRPRDTCLRLCATLCAWNGDVQTAIELLDAAAPLSAAVYGKSSLRVDIAWTLAICRQAFRDDGQRGPLTFVMSLALLDLQASRAPQERLTDVDELQHLLVRTRRGYLSLLANRLVLRMAREVPDLPLSIEDRCKIFNNYGTALLRAQASELAVGAFAETICFADSLAGGLTGEDRVAVDYQRMHALGGMGFAHYNLSSQAQDPADKLATLLRSAAAFEAAFHVRGRVGSRSWLDGRIWAVAGLVAAKLGRTDEAWRQFASALLAGLHNWSWAPETASLNLFFNPDSDTREKITEGLEHLNANHAAVLFGKAALHAVHFESVPDVDAPLSREYVRARSGVHRTLVRCLTAVGRHNEAEQAFALLKDDSWGIYARSLEVPIDVESAVAPTLAEAAGIERSGLNAVVSALATKTEADDEAIARLAEALSQLDASIASELAARKLESDNVRGRIRQWPLTSTDALLRYVVSPSETSITVETEAGVVVERVKVDYGELSALAFTLRQAIRGNGPESVDYVSNFAAYRLERLLILPVRAHLQGVDHLWLEVDSPLEGVPFAALYDGRSHLVDDYSIAFVDAVGFKPKDGYARQTNAVDCDGDRDATITVFACSELVGARLPGAAAEAVAIADAVTAKKGRGVRVECYEHEQCTVSRFVKQLEQRGQFQSAVHLATHAEFNATSDALSVLALSDGNLSIRRLRAALAHKGLDVGTFVLSACGTARQDLDVEGFSGTLLRAGAGAVLSSLWETLDADAPVFFGAFYAACDDFASPRQMARALRQAQRALQAIPSNNASLESNRLAQWAPYVVRASRIA